MDARQITALAERIKDEVKREVNDRLPRKVGIIAVNHFRQNFRDGGYLDGNLRKWKRTRRQDGNGSDAKYGPLTSRRDHLMRSIQSTPGHGEVTVSDPVPYAAIHNQGGTVSTHPTVTPKMRKMAWAKVYSLAGSNGKLPKDLPEEARKWKGLALTKKTRLNISANIPQRQFMGNSQELATKVNSVIMDSINKIKDGISTITAH